MSRSIENATAINTPNQLSFAGSDARQISLRVGLVVVTCFSMTPRLC
jgi:hypothetical protein